MKKQSAEITASAQVEDERKVTQMNKVTLIGRMVAAPELKATSNGTSVTSFSIAVQKRFKDADGNYGVDFIDCVAWKQTAEFLAKFFTRGQQVGIVGSIQTRTYKTQAGDNRKVTEVLVEEAYFCGDYKKEDTKPTAPPEMETLPEDEELPF